MIIECDSRMGDSSGMGVYGSRVVIIVEGSVGVVSMLGKQVQEEVKEMRELTGGRIEEFSTPRSEAFLCLGNEFFEVHSPLHLFILNVHI